MNTHIIINAEPTRKRGGRIRVQKPATPNTLLIYIDHCRTNEDIKKAIVNIYDLQRLRFNIDDNPPQNKNLDYSGVEFTNEIIITMDIPGRPESAYKSLLSIARPEIPKGYTIEIIDI